MYANFTGPSDTTASTSLDAPFDEALTDFPVSNAQNLQNSDTTSEAVVTVSSNNIMEADHFEDDMSPLTVTVNESDCQPQSAENCPSDAMVMSDVIATDLASGQPQIPPDGGVSDDVFLSDGVLSDCDASQSKSRHKRRKNKHSGNIISHD
jgi:hypothetical protein